jgi:hypothetical protein
MTIEYDEKGKFYTDRIKKIAEPAIIQTTTHLIRGFVHVKMGERLKDALDQDGSFVAITDANIFDANNNLVYHSPFLIIQRGQIVWIMPAKDATKLEDEK